MAVCYRHPGRETNVGCSNCGRPICPDCMTSTPVGMRCPDCARERTKVHRAPAGFGAAGQSPVTYGLIGVNVAVFVLAVVTGAGLFGGGGTIYRDFALFGPAVADGEAYRVLTSGFLHYGLIHLGLNMFALYFLGGLLEPAVGRWRFVGIYLVSLLGGSLGAMALEPEALTAGASGAVFGMMAAAFVVARDRGRDDVAQQIGLIVVLNLVFTFSVPGISIGGHLGGLLAGGLCAVLVGALARSRHTRAVELAVFVGLGTIAALVTVALAPDTASLFGPR
ncbi:MAG: rhomboid family intramembrane serine protease [Actinomycetota bacterium]|nr:rhomboid family intramembrane serine protease [Actinomycetota bacterium]